MKPPSKGKETVYTNLYICQNLSLFQIWIEKYKSS